MKLFPAFPKNKKKQLSTKVEEGKSYLSIDIGTEFIKTAVVRVNANKQIEVIGYDRTPQKESAMRGAMITDLDSVTNSVDISIGNAIKQAEELFGQISLPSSAIFGIAGELVKGITIVVNYEREDSSYSIEQAEINDVLDQIREQAYTNAKLEIAEDIGIPVEQLVEISTNINSTEIDGTKIDNPIGFTGKTITYRIYGTFAPKIHLDALQSVADRLQLGVVSMVVAPYAIAVGAKNANEEKFSGIFVDVGGGTSDIALVQNGNVIGTNMFAFGGRVFTKRLEQEMNLDYLAAEKMKLDYADQKLSKEESKTIQQYFSKDIPIWIDGVALSLSDFEDVVSYPAKIYLCGGGAMLPDIRAGLLEYPWLKSLPFAQFPKINFILPNQIRDVIDLTRTVVDPRDVMPMALSRMLLDRLENK
jgi:cell division protein FtsA